MRAPALALAALLALAPPAAAASPARYTFGYQVSFVGLFDLDLTGELDLGPADYSFAIDLKTEGLTDLATRFRMSAQSAGAHGSPVSPRAHDSRTVSRFSGTRSAKIRWNEAHVAVSEMKPPPKQDGREPVRPEQTVGSVDPLSALLVALLQGQPAEACAGRIAVFDGRRRYDLLPRPAAVERIEPRQTGAFAGPALHCRLFVERIAGYSKKVDQGQRPADQPGFEVWFAQRADLPLLLPARIYADTHYGEVVANLVRLEVNGRPVDLQGG